MYSMHLEESRVPKELPIDMLSVHPHINNHLQTLLIWVLDCYPTETQDISFRIDCDRARGSTSSSFPRAWTDYQISTRSEGKCFACTKGNQFIPADRNGKNKAIPFSLPVEGTFLGLMLSFQYSRCSLLDMEQEHWLGWNACFVYS